MASDDIQLKPLELVFQLRKNNLSTPYIENKKGYVNLRLQTHTIERKVLCNPVIVWIFIEKIFVGLLITLWQKVHMHDSTVIETFVGELFFIIWMCKQT
jgi:hypothetical protein